MHINSNLDRRIKVNDCRYNKSREYQRRSCKKRTRFASLSCHIMEWNYINGVTLIFNKLNRGGQECQANSRQSS